MKKYIRLVLWGTGIIFLVCLSTLIACNLMIVNNANGKTFYEIDSIAPLDYGLRKKDILPSVRRKYKKERPKPLFM